MKIAIQFTNQSGDSEYLSVFGGYSTSLNCPNVRLFTGKDDADYEIHKTKQSIGCAPIWDTAKPVGVKLIGTWEV